MQKESLDILIGEKLTSVTFVMDYLQVDFDGNQYTFYIWPEIKVNSIAYKFGDNSYRDSLCALIGKVVTAATYVDQVTLDIVFDQHNSLGLSLDPNNPDIFAEIAIFTDVNKQWYVFD